VKYVIQPLATDGNCVAGYLKYVKYVIHHLTPHAPLTRLPCRTLQQVPL